MNTYMGRLWAWRAFNYYPQELESWASSLWASRHAHPGEPLGSQAGLNPLGSHNFHFPVLGVIEDTAPTPTLENETGFWAFKRKSDIIDYTRGLEVSVKVGMDSGFVSPGFRPTVVYGLVELQGTVIEHEDGYRASKIVILSLYSKANNSRRRAMAHRMGWPGRILPISEAQEAFTANLTEIPAKEKS